MQIPVGFPAVVLVDERTRTPIHDESSLVFRTLGQRLTSSFAGLLV